MVICILWNMWLNIQASINPYKLLFYFLIFLNTFKLTYKYKNIFFNWFKSGEIDFYELFT